MQNQHERTHNTGPHIELNLGFPGSSVGKESACNVEDLGLIPGSGRSPGEGNGYPHQCSGLENPHGQRSLMDYSPWGCKESDMTERLSLLHRTKFDGRLDITDEGLLKVIKWNSNQSTVRKKKRIGWKTHMCEQQLRSLMYA